MSLKKWAFPHFPIKQKSRECTIRRQISTKSLISCLKLSGSPKLVVNSKRSKNFSLAKTLQFSKFNTSFQLANKTQSPHWDQSLTVIIQSAVEYAKLSRKCQLLRYFSLRLNTCPVKSRFNLSQTTIADHPNRSWNRKTPNRGTSQQKSMQNLRIFARRNYS